VQINLTPLLVAVAVVTLATASNDSVAQARPFVAPPPISPPTLVTASQQPWLVFQDWFCRGPNTSPANFAQGMRNRMSELSAQGWEIVSFTHAPIAGQECFAATFKAPTKSK
jgi:hypothetical protein